MYRFIFLSIMMFSAALGAAAGDARAQQPPQEAEDGVVVRTSLVSVRVSVTDARGRRVAGLTRDRFEVFDDRQRQRIAHFADEDAPVSLGVVYDVTGLPREQIARTLRSVKRFARDANGERDFFILAFNERVSASASFVPDADQIIEHLATTETGETVSLYDVIYRATERVSAGSFGKKALLVISNGRNVNGLHAARELRDRLRESDVQVFAVGAGDPERASIVDLETVVLARGERAEGSRVALGDIEAALGRAVLDELTRVSGGYASFSYLTSEPQLDELCARMAGELRRQYVIGFYPSARAGDGKWHVLEVRLKGPARGGEVSLSYRNGYRSGER